MTPSFTELIDYAITHHYPTLEFLSTTGRTTFVEDIIRKYEHVIQRTIQNIETHDFWNIWPGLAGASGAVAGPP